MLYLCRFKPLRHYLRGFLIAAWAGDKIAEFSFPEISFHFPLRPWFFFVSPAYAGKSRECARGLTRARNHPRVCGEKCHSRLSAASAEGSPPRMRGKVTLQDVPCDSVGITPRVCGEKAEQIKKSSADTGSPPHVRGKETRQAGLLRAPGITPAYAGKSAILD